MRAVVAERYGPPGVLRLVALEKPSPGKRQVLIRIHATTVAPSDVLIRSGKFPLLFWPIGRALFGLVKPRRLIPGYELAGVIEAVGSEVTRFETGDEVFGASTWRLSCNAEYICLPETGALAKKPTGLTFEEAAASADGACTALHFLRKGGIRKGQRVLVYGASGSIGTMGVQLAKHLGAQVTGVCGPTNIELVRSLGANEVLDYTKDDFARDGERYDVVFDTVGKSSFEASMRALRPGGVYLTTVMPLGKRLRGIWTSIRSGKRVRNGMSMSNAEDLRFLAGLLESGALRPVIDRRYPLERISDAHEYVARGHKKGNVVVTLEGPRDR